MINEHKWVPFRLIFVAFLCLFENPEKQIHLDCRRQNVVITDYHGSYIIIIRAIVNYKHFMMTLERFYYGVY